MIIMQSHDTRHVSCCTMMMDVQFVHDVRLTFIRKTYFKDRDFALAVKNLTRSRDMTSYDVSGCRLTSPFKLMSSQFIMRRGEMLIFVAFIVATLVVVEVSSRVYFNIWPLIKPDFNYFRRKQYIFAKHTKKTGPFLADQSMRNEDPTKVLLKKWMRYRYCC